MLKIVYSAQNILRQQISLDTDAWKKIRVESQKLLNLWDERVAIEKDVRNLQDNTPVKGKIFLLRGSLSMAKKEKDARTRYSKRARQAEETALESVNETIKSMMMGTSYTSAWVAKQKASMEGEMRARREREAAETASLDAEIGNLEAELMEEEAKVREAQELMKKALSSCEKAINATVCMILHRASELKGSRVEVVDTADVLSIRRICGWKWNSCLKGFRLRFVVGRSVGGSETSFCEEIGALSYGAIDVEVGEVYEVRIDEEGECHFSKLAHDVKEENPNV